MADGTVTIDTSLNNKGFVKGLSGMQKQTTGLTAAVKRLGAVIASAFAVRAIVNFGKECVELGSDIAEVQNVVDVAFGDMAYKIEDFANSAIQNFGMSRLAAKKTASTYMAMARGMGMAEGQASDMAIALTGLSGDVASFFNVSQELADVKLKSIFTGETETLKDLGVVMTQTNLKAYALSHGMSGNIESMTQSQLVMLRYQYVMEQLSLAQGDFVRTQDSWANQTRILSMQWQEFMSIIGDSLIKVLTPVLKVLNQIVESMITAATTINQVVTAIFGSSAAETSKTEKNAAGVGDAIEGSVENQDNLTDAVNETNKAEKKSLATFDELNTLTSGTKDEDAPKDNAVTTIPSLVEETSAAGGVAQRILEMVEAVRKGISDIAASIKSVWDMVAGNVQTAVEKIRAAAAGLGDFFRGVWEDIASLGAPFTQWFSGDYVQYLRAFIDLCGTVISGLLDTFKMVFSDLWTIVIFPFLQKLVTDILPFLTQVGTQIIKTLEVLFSEVKRIFDLIWSEGIAPALELIMQMFSDYWDSLIAAWKKWGAPIFENIRAAIKKTADTLVNIWDTILKPALDSILATIKKLWDGHLRPLLDNILNMIGTLVNNALRIYNEALLPIVNFLVDTFGPAFTAVFDGIAGIVEPILGGIIDFISGIVTVLTGLSNFVTGVFVKDWDMAWKGLGEIADGVMNSIEGMFSGVINSILSGVEGFVNSFISGVNAIIDALNSIDFDVPDWVPLIGGNTFGLNISNIPEVALPRLATGAVIPPNREFMAVLGDQKSGTNIEAPVSEIESAVTRGIAAAGGGSPQQITVLMELDRRQIGRVVYELNKSESQRVGVSLVNK
ncbi:hypothetical protein [Oscillibacter sp. GMB15532]|uniref:phage tail protein n=1 Tax=Oscillibacter sp. GMB15532 TaxID=3230022 RepID=UPI0034DE198A